jgi:glycopeptide antibiotics resistance protein
LFGARLRARSTHTFQPWPEAPAFELSPTCPVGAVAAILYASLLPFSFVLGSFTAANWFGLRELAVHAATFEQIVTQLLIYVPFGFCMAGCRITRRWNLTTRFLIAIFLGTCLSIAAESIQAGLAERVSSWTDVALNSLGTIIGAFVALTSREVFLRIGHAILQSFRERPFSTSSIGLSTGLLLFGLMPFDFVRSSEELHASFARARWNIMQPGDAVLPGSQFTSEESAEVIGTAGATPLKRIVAQWSAAAWFALLGILLALGRRDDGRQPIAAFASALKNGLTLVVVIEMMQLFLADGVFDVSRLLLGGLALTFGAWTAIMLIDPMRTMKPVHDTAHRATLLLLTLLVIVQLVFILLTAHGRQPIAISDLSVLRLDVLPFESLWRMPILHALADLASMFVVAGALALSLVMLLERTDVPHPVLATVSAVCTCCIVQVTLQSATLGTTFDITPVMVWGLSAAVVCDLCAWLCNPMPQPGRERLARQLG